MSDRNVLSIQLPRRIHHPFIACTTEELARLRDEHRSYGDARKLIDQYQRLVQPALESPLRFPPRGGQHNQWYQCEKCQTALKTIDESHHQCPLCQTVYTGHPYDDVIFAHIHEKNLADMILAAWVYAATGGREYADLAARVLVGYGQRYRNYPYHSSDAKQGAEAKKSGGHLFEQTLNESAFLALRIAPSFDLIHDTLSEEQRNVIRDGLIRPMLVNLDKHRAGKNNWQTWHNAAMVWGGAMLDDVSWIDRAINDPEHGFLYQMTASVSAEGMWYENSWGYHFYALQGLIAAAEGCRRLGIDLWSHPTLRRMFTLPLRYTMPDGSLPRYADTVECSLLEHPSRTPSHPRPMAHAAYIFGDPNFAALIAPYPTIESVLFGLTPVENKPPMIRGSEVFQGAGHAILRSEGDANLAAVLTFGPHGGFHGHFDKLSFVFFGHGRELGVDPGRAESQAYRLPIHTDWYRATIAHNGVVIDGISQQPAAGKLECFVTTPTHSIAIARCDEAYPGVAHRRLLLLSSTYLLILDDLTSDREHEFTWVYHHRGEAIQCDVPTRAGQLPATFQGSEYLQNIRSARLDSPAAIECFAPDVRLRLVMNAKPHTQLHLADGPGKSVSERIPLVMFTRNGTSARFAAVLEPLTSKDRTDVSAVELRERAGEVEVLVHHGGVIDNLLLNPDSLRFIPHGAATIIEETHR